MNQALRLLWAAAISFGLGVALCVWLEPSDILSHDGLSFYGNFHRTFLPYGLGLGATAYFIIRACQRLSGTQAARSFRVGLEGVGVGILGIIATPSFSTVWLIQDMHVLFGLAIFITQAILSLHYLIKARRGWVDWGLLGLQLVAIVLVALSFSTFSVFSLMLPAQVLAISAFGALLIRAVSYRNHHAALKEKINQ